MNHQPPQPITEDDLHGYVDGCLTPARRAEVGAYLAQRPDEARRLDAYAGQNRQLHALFDPLLAQATPAPRSMVKAPAAAPGATAAPWLRLAAASVLVLAGGMAGWVLRGAGAGAGAPAAGVQLAHMAAVAHAVYTPEQRRPVEIGAAQEAQLVAWLSKRLGTPVHAPTLDASGFTLIGGRLLPGGSGPVAQFMYQDGAGQRLTLYVSHQAAAQPDGHPPDAAFRFAREGAVNVFYWIDGNFGYALSGNIDQRTLGTVAGAVYRQLEPAAPH